MVGNSGIRRERLALVTANARTFCDLICGITDSEVAKMSWHWPAITSTSAGAALLYGTCTIRTPAILLNNSADRCAAAPMPEPA